MGVVCGPKLWGLCVLFADAHAIPVLTVASCFAALPAAFAAATADDAAVVAGDHQRLTHGFVPFGNTCLQP